MKLSKFFAFFCAAGFLAGCASFPRELSDHKFIPGGEITGTANNDRPENIKYQKVAENTQYVLASDSLVISTYNKLLQDLSSDETTLEVSDVLFLMAGTWDKIRNTKQDGMFNKRSSSYKFDAGREQFTFRVAVPKTPKSAQNAWKVVREEIRRPAIYTAEPGSEEANALGEIRIRSISTQEMATIVWFCQFKIIEPIFVVNDTYLLGFNKEGKLELIDEIPYYVPFYEKLMAIVQEYEEMKRQASQQQQQQR